jgi:hypothetical protein
VKIRLHGTEEECREAVERLAGIVEVLAVSEPYPDRRASVLVRVYVEARIAPPVHVTSTTEPQPRERRRRSRREVPGDRAHRRLHRRRLRRPVRRQVFQRVGAGVSLHLLGRQSWRRQAGGDRQHARDGRVLARARPGERAGHRPRRARGRRPARTAVRARELPMTTWQPDPALGVVDVRVSGEMPDIVRFTDLVTRMPGVELLYTRGPWPNRRNPGVRVHLTVRLAAGEQQRRRSSRTSPPAVTRAAAMRSATRPSGTTVTASAVAGITARAESRRSTIPANLPSPGSTAPARTART